VEKGFKKLIRQDSFTIEDAQNWLKECWMGSWVEGCDDDNLVALVNYYIHKSLEE
jgi:hypothetical protein